MGYKLNMISSGGVHSGNALRSEFAFLISRDLIDTSGGFVMFCDDFWYLQMQSAIHGNAQKPRALFESDPAHISMLELQGMDRFQRPIERFSSLK